MNVLLGIDIQLRGMVLVLPTDVIPYVNKVEVIDLLFLDQYALFFVGMYKKLLSAIHFLSLITCF